jgi:putative Mg2+ transporter-C (MgtC) family protein
MTFDEFGDPELWSRVGMALLCGGIIGLERQLRGKPAGMRTSSLICLGTAMFIYLGSAMQGEAGDPSRVLGQVVTGIGFLGAGVIMTRNGLVTGVTSAAVVWLLAAVGSAVGVGRFGVALAMSLVSVGVLVGVERLEHAFSALRRGVHAVSDVTDSENPAPQDASSEREQTVSLPRTSGAPPRRR